MGTKHIDHINRNPLDNRLCNLRFTNSLFNGQNRNPISTNIEGVNGIVKKKHLNYYVSFLESNRIVYRKIFYIDTHGEKTAKRLSILFRQHVLEISVEYSDIITQIEYDSDDIRAIKFSLKQYNDYLDLHVSKTVVDPDKYMNIMISDSIYPEEKNLMFQKYLILQSHRLLILESKIKQLETILKSLSINIYCIIEQMS